MIRLFRKRKTFVVAAIGDSLIEGKSASNEIGWVSLLVKHLERKRKIVFLNTGKGGNTSVKVAARLAEDCLDHDPDLIILGYGVNDSRHRPSLGRSEVEIEEFSKTTEEMFTNITQRSSAMVLVSGLVPVQDEMVDPYKEDKHYRRTLQVPYDNALKQLSKKYGYLFLDVFPKWISRGEDFIASHLADGLHPNDKGHQFIADHAAEFLLSENSIFDGK